MEVIPLLTLDLHPIFRNNRDIDLACGRSSSKLHRPGLTLSRSFPAKGQAN
jgi:hypothetical protein